MVGAKALRQNMSGTVKEQQEASVAATAREARTRTWKPGPQRSQLKPWFNFNERESLDSLSRKRTGSDMF